MLRILLAGIVGGIVVFIWGAVSHMVLQVGEMGIKELPNDELLLPALRTGIPDPGMYMIPGPDKAAPTDMKAWEKKMQAGPRGLLVIDPRPTDQPMISPVQLGRELASNVLAALVAACIVSTMFAGTFARVLAVAAMGLFGWLSLVVSYWNWYGFPDDFAIGQLIGEVVGWFLAGLLIAPIAPKPAIPAAAM